MNPARYRLLAMAIALWGISGCQHIGPKTIVDDRIPYNDAVATSWKQQTLLNIVRLRYADVVEFVDIPSIVNGYEHGHSASGGFGAQFFSRDPLKNSLGVDLLGTHTLVDRPTISYLPQTSSEFTRNLTHPLPPVTILNLIESGYPADVVLEIAVESINGLRNRGFAGVAQRADPEFQEVAQGIKKAQMSGHVSLRVVPSADPATPDVVLGVRDQDIAPSVAEELDQLRRLMRLDPEVHEFKIVFGMLPKEKDEIAFRTRSVFQMLRFLALHVQVPEAHLADGRAPDLGDSGSPTEPPLTVFSGCEKPSDFYTAIRYQGYWFWVDQRDYASKRTFLYLKVMLALANTEEKIVAPALTIRAN